MKKGLTLVLFLLAISTGLLAQVVISAQDFIAENKANKELVIIDANKASDYTKSHVTGAVNVPHTELYKEGDIEGLIKSPEALAQYFGDNGISNTSAIVIYDDGSGKYNSRVFWVLKYLGVSNVKLLHKDMNDWKKARVPLTRSKTVIKKTTFTPAVDKSILATIADVKSGSAKIVDSRDAEEFAGTAEKSDGHIPNAINIDYKEFLTDTEAFKTKADIEAVANKHGLKKGDAIILYCVTSVRAGTSYVALAEIAGWPNVRVYDGAYNEWVGQGNKLATD